MPHDQPLPSIGALVLPRRQPPPDAWRQFLSWPGSTSLVTLVSAALLLAGLHGIIEPSIGVEGSTGPRWQVLGTLSAYLAALLSGIWAMCRARAGHPDAIASAVIGVVFAVGYGVIIQLIAPEQAGLAWAAAVAGWLGLLALGVGFARIAGGGWGGVGSALALLTAWTTLWPLALSRTVVSEAARMPTAVAGSGGTDVAVMVWWTAGWLTVLVGIAWLIQRVCPPDVENDMRPFLHRPAMRWVLVLVAVLSAIVVLALQAHIAGLDVAASDVMPATILFCLLVGEVAARQRVSAVRDGVLVAVPAAVSAWITLAGWGPDGSAQFRGEGWAPQLVGLAGTSPGAPLVAALAAVVVSLRRPSTGLRWGAGLAVITAILAWDQHQPLIAEAGILVALALAWLAWQAHRAEVVVMMVAVATGLAPALQIAERMLGTGLPRPVLALALSTGVVLVATLWRPAWIGQSWARIAAWGHGLIAIGLAVHLLHGRGSGPLPGGLVTEGVLVAASLLLILACAWRRRDLALVAGAVPGLVVLAWPAIVWLLPRSKAWLAVWGAFALLGVGVLLAVRRARPVSPDPFPLREPVPAAVQPLASAADAAPPV